MSVVGVDLGNLNTVIAVARNRGVDIICNEVSNRMTPTMVAFGPKNRYLGESAKTNEISNFRNTVACIKRIMGRDLEEVKQTEGKYINAQLCEKEGEAAVSVNYLGEEASFRGTELMAMFLSKVKEITQAEVKNAAMDLVLAVPPFFTDRQRRALLDAAEIAGVRCLRLINEGTAAALAYGMPKSDLPEAPAQARNVVFVNVGHAAYSVTVVSYLKGQLEVLGVAYDSCFGGRDFDELLVDHFCNEFATKRGLDIRSNKKALHRLRMAAERAKKVLSANAVTQLQVENIMDEVDVSAEINRATFEEMIAPLMSRFSAPIQEALRMAGLEAHQMDAIELVGGGTRIPAIKNVLMTIFGKELSTTLNQDEAVARGCALQCALHSPVFKVRNFSLQDCTSVGVKFCWDALAELPEDFEYEVFPPGQHTPSTKMLSFKRPLPFALKAVYSTTGAVIGEYTIGEGQAGDIGADAMIKVKTRVNPSGVYSVESAFVVAKSGEEAPASPVSDSSTQLSVSTCTPTLNKQTLMEKAEAEASMCATDKLVAATSDARNGLEEYIYEVRGKMESTWSAYASPADKERLQSLMAAAEQWLYSDEGEDATKSVYLSKLQELKSIGGPVAERYREHDAIPAAAELLRQCIAEYTALAASKEERYAHIEASERAKVVAACASKEKWLKELLAKQAEKPLHQPLLVTSPQIIEEKNRLISTCFPLMNKAKPVSAAQGPQDNAKKQEKGAEEELLLTDEEHEEEEEDFGMDE
jgi:heat shock protein 4